MKLFGWRAGLAAFIAYTGLSAPAFAQGIFYTPDQQPSAWNVTQKPATWDINLAAGGAMLPTFPGSDRYRAAPIPLVVIRYRDMVSLGVDGLNIYWHTGNLRVGGGVSYDGGRADHESSGFLGGGDNRLNGLGNISAAVGVRGFATYQIGPAYLDSSIVKYLGTQNKGILVNLGVSAPMALSKQFIFRPHAGVTWADGNFMQTFFGVSAVQASHSIFARYDTGAGLEDANAGVTLVYLLSSHWFLGADASVKQYLDGAANSPITITNTNATVAAVVGYHF